MKKKLCALALCALVLCGCGVGPTSTSAPSSAPESAQEVPEAPPEPTALERARERLAALTVEEKVGQMFFARRPERGSAEDAAAWHLGGYVLFGRDYEDSEGNYLTQEAFLQNIQADQTAAKADTGIPLLIGSDEEGGTVTRASRNPNLSSRRPSSLPRPCWPRAARRPWRRTPPTSPRGCWSWAST